MFINKVLYKTGDHGFYTFRIPALVATRAGSLLAFCEARRGLGGDWDPSQILLRRSTDGGETWGEPILMSTGGEGPASNSVPIVDQNTGRVHFISHVSYERAYYISSDDDGLTWSAPRDITATFEQFRPEYNWRVCATGPGHGIQLQSGRLLAGIWLSTGTGSEFGPGKLGHRPSCIATIFSDDHGATWQRGDIVQSHNDDIRNPSENIPYEHSDGRVQLNIRSESVRHRRLVAYSTDGATGWSVPAYHEGLFEPVCMASIIRLDSQRALFTNPDSEHLNGIPSSWGSLPRENLTVKLSEDDGLTWPIKKPIDAGVAGYSDLAVLPDSTICCIYEGGAISGNQFRNTHFSFARFDLAWLKS